MERDRLADDIVMIALHGVALSKSEVRQITAPLRQSFRLKGVRWVFPRAPWRRLTLLGGRPALAWYDLLSWDRSRVDAAGLEEATLRLHERIEAHAPDSESRIVLAGFSQGGALALHAALRLGGALAGVVAVSSALPSLDELRESRPDAPPFFLAHGLFDSVVPYSMGRHSMRELVAKGYRVEWHTYPIGHWISQRCLADVASWLERRVLADRAEPAASAPRREWGLRRRIVELAATLGRARLALPGRVSERG